MTAFVIAGTDTGVGKTIFSAGLAGYLGAAYWKPVQAGLDEETDSELVARLSGARVLPEAYRLRLPASPHHAAAQEQQHIDPALLNVPPERPLVIETAGGVMVPLNPEWLFIDQMARWGLPVILVARTTLGTINHSLLSLEALRARTIDVHGIAFIGEAAPASEAAICHFGKVRALGRLPHLPVLDRAHLAGAFAESFAAL